MDDKKMARVLVAEDEEAVLTLLAKHIKAAGFDVVTALDGQDAWEKIKTTDPDVIILDLTMPGRDGFSILQELRAHPPSKKWQPVIIVSGQDEVPAIKKGYDLEADHYITKPCRMEEIIKAINLVLTLIPHRILSDESSPDVKSTKR